MKALCWRGTDDIRCDSVPDAQIEGVRDVIVKVTSWAICGSDLNLMDGLMPTMEAGDVLGHELMGEVVEVAPGFTKFKKGDRILVPFTINAAIAGSAAWVTFRAANARTATRRWPRNRHGLGAGRLWRAGFSQHGPDCAKGVHPSKRPNPRKAVS